MVDHRGLLPYEAGAGGRACTGTRTRTTRGARDTPAAGTRTAARLVVSIGADFLVRADVRHANHAEPPQIMGQLLHLFTAPNRFGLPDFYTLHVWALKESPTGAFVNWHANVSCDAYTPPTP